MARAKVQEAIRGIELVAEALPDGPTQFTVGGYTIGRNGIVAQTGSAVYDEWELVGQRLSVMERGLQFAVGDWMNLGEERFNEMASQAIDQANWSPRTVRIYRWVAESVPMQNRRMDRGLSFRHHMVVAKLKVRDQRRWLDQACGDEESGPWSVKRLRDALAEGQDLPEIAWHVLVTCKNAADMAKFIKKTELEGRGCKPIIRRGRKPSEV